MSSWPEGVELTEVRGGGTNLHPQDKKTKVEDNFFSMKGPEVFKLSLPKVHSMILNILNRNNINKSDIDFIIPHQASGRGVDAYSRYGGFEAEKIMNIVGDTGNCVSASLPLALSLAYESKFIHKDSIVLLVGTGAGLSIASSVIRL